MSNYHDISHLSAELLAVNLHLILIFSRLTPLPHREGIKDRASQAVVLTPLYNQSPESRGGLSMGQ